MTRPDDDKPTPDEPDDLFAEVDAAISTPPRRDSETFGVTAEDAAQPAEVVEDAEEIDLEEDEAAADSVASASGEDGAPEPDVDETVVQPPPPQTDPVTTLPPPDSKATTVQPPVSVYDDLFAPPAEPPTADEPSTDEEEPPRSHRGRRILIGAVLLLGLAYVGGYFLTGMRMPANATIAGVDVSGTSPKKARSLLTSELTPHTEKDITLTHDQQEFTIKPADAGLSLDVDESVRAAGGESSWDPRDMAALFFGTHDHDAVVDAESTKLAAVLGSIGETVDVPVVQPQITFPDGEPTARQPEEGTVVDKTGTTELIKHLFVGDADETAVVMKTVQPAVDAEGLQEAMDGIAQTIVSGPVTIEVGEKSIDLPVSAYAPATVVRVEGDELKPYIDPKTLAEPLLDSTTGIGKKAVDATVELKNGKPVVVPGKEGVGLHPEEMAEKLLPAIATTGDERSVSIEAKVVDPLFTTEDAEKLKITEKISSFTTEYPPAAYRDTNQGRAAELIDGTIIKPGETFSFNKVVGERTRANGFVSGTVINGGVFREELGGGVSQVATTMYNAGFFGGMDDVEHHPHAFYISRYPVGREATVYWGSLDLRWKNSTKYGVLIHAWVDKSGPGRNGRMNVELWSTKVYDIKAGQSAKRNFRSPGTRYDDTNRCVPQAPIQGFDIDIYRTFYKGGKKVKTETDTAVYQAADHVICGKKPKADDADDD